MPKIEIRFKNRILDSHLIREARSLSIGRSPDNDIVIDNAAVSGKHARIIPEGDAYFVKDLNSTNGTFVNNKMIASRMLHGGDIITIGKHELVFQLTGETGSKDIGAPIAESGGASIKTTFSLDTQGYRDMMAKNIYDPNKATLLIFQFKGKQIRKYLLNKDKQLVIGRLPDNDVVIENDAVSGTHARIIANQDVYFLEDLNSTNGTFVNEKQITSHPLKDGDIITVGKHELVFCEYEAYTMEEILLPNDPDCLKDATLTMHVPKFTKKSSSRD